MALSESWRRADAETPPEGTDPLLWELGQLRKVAQDALAHAARVLLVLSGSLLGLGVILWGIASDPEKHGGLWTFVVTGIAISTVWLLVGWGRHFFTTRNVLVPVIINVVLLIWIWSARPKT